MRPGVHRDDRTQGSASVTTAAEYLLQLQGVVVRYGVPGADTTPALAGISLAVRPGDAVGVMGASGSGKSTLLHVLSRLTKPDAGSVQYATDFKMPSLVFQFPENQLFSETVEQDIAYGLRESGIASDAVASRVRSSMQAVGLDPETFSGRVPFHLSAGERRRVALAGALAQQRQLLLLDEPTLGLDSRGIDQLQAILLQLRQANVTYWIASHDADFVAATCSSLVVLAEGRIAYQGPAAGFWGDPERAQDLGVSLPRRAQVRQRLEDLGIHGLPSHPEESELVAALTAYRAARPA